MVSSWDMVLSIWEYHPYRDMVIPTGYYYSPIILPIPYREGMGSVPGGGVGVDAPHHRRFLYVSLSIIWV